VVLLPGRTGRLGQDGRASGTTSSASAIRYGVTSTVRGAAPAPARAGRIRTDRGRRVRFRINVAALGLDPMSSLTNARESRPLLRPRHARAHRVNDTSATPPLEAAHVDTRYGRPRLLVGPVLNVRRWNPESVVLWRPTHPGRVVSLDPGLRVPRPLSGSNWHFAIELRDRPTQNVVTMSLAIKEPDQRTC
jgi:hypothetical protein